jgi:hypothetical protein
MGTLEKKSGNNPGKAGHDVMGRQERNWEQWGRLKATGNDLKGRRE